ncbi:MAG TPA: SDR family oxidoreductase [Mycobacteriales bacterium]|nr:SDR family oxidoreductase [Mycobacteriales bacterium]
MDDALRPAAGGRAAWSDLTGHVAVVTGGNGGIGLGIAAGLVDAGADVCIWGTNETKTAAALERLAGAAGSATAMTVDVSDEQAVVAAMARVVADHGRLDSCFANAGIGGITHPLLDTTLERFHHITAVDLDGAFVTIREAARHMVALENGGSIVATSSVSARFGAPRNYAYAAAKEGLLAIVKGVAVEMARHGIRANALLPGWTSSDMTEREAFADARFVAATMPRMPVRRWGEPADFGAIAVYLASPASAFHTGDGILIDGGYAAF